MLGGMGSSIYGRTFNAATTSWVAQVVTNGGTVSSGQKMIVDNLIVALTTAGAWAKMDDAWLLSSESSVQALTSLKQLRLATAVNAPTFTVRDGYAFDGATNYIRTGFIPSTHAVSMTGSNMRIEDYSLNASASSAGFNAGATSGGTTRILLRNLSGSSMTFGLNSTSTAITNPSSQGMVSTSRTGAGVFEAFRNGVSLGTAVPTSTGTTLTNIEIYIGALNSSGVANNFRSSRMGWVSVGASLTAAEELAAYNAVQTYMTALGVQV